MEKKKGMRVLTLIAICCISVSQAQTGQVRYDKIIRDALIYDGSGAKPFRGDIAINADTIAAIGNLRHAHAPLMLNAKGMAAAPGFINMLSQADNALMEDGRSESDIRQGVTLEVMGEGSSMGPLNEKMQEQLLKGQGDIKFAVTWNTLCGFLRQLEKKGISCNVASFVGATSVRKYVVGEGDRAPTSLELDSMRALVRQAMEEGAMGLSTSLIYAPAFFARTDELIALAREASRYNGLYISHMRSEGNRLLESLEELITIAKQAHIAAEVFHLKAAGKNNWSKMDSVIRRIQQARADGLKISADMYTYAAGATGLTSCFPPKLQDGGFGKLWKRLQDPAVRAQMQKMMHENTDDWENFYYAVGSPDNILLLGFKQDSMKHYTGRTLSEVARLWGSTPEEAAMDLIVRDSSRVTTAYFLMNEENIKKQIKLPWVSFGSDAASLAPEGVFLKYNPHPRAYGNFARVIGKYVREEHTMPLALAIYKLSKLPAMNLKLKKRGELKVGYYADVVVFDPAHVRDLATYEQPHQYATGMEQVFVNGVQVLKDGQHTGATPGRFIKGPGYKGTW